MLACVTSLWRGAVQVPEDAPPAVQESWRLAQRDVLLPPDLGEEGLGCFLRADMKKIFVNVKSESDGKIKKSKLD